MATIPVVSQQKAEVGLNGITTDTFTLATPVDETQSILIFSVRANHNQPQYIFVRGEILAGGTQVQFTRQLASGFIGIEYSVTEFDSTVNVQHITMTGATTQTISSVDLSRSIIIKGGMSNGGGTAGTDDAVRLKFNSSTEIASSANSGTTQAVRCQVVEFPADAIESVQYVESTISAADADVTIASVDTSKSVIFATSRMSANFGCDDIYIHSFTDSTTATFKKPTGGSVTADMGFFVVEFTDYDVAHTAIPLLTWATDTPTIVSGTNDDLILSTTLLLPYWMNSTSTDDDTGTSAFSVDMKTTDQIFFRRQSTASAANLNYDIIDWGQTVASTGAELAGTVTGTSSAAGTLITTGAELGGTATGASSSTGDLTVIPAGTSVTGGTLTPAISETLLESTGGTITLTLTNDTWIAI